MFGDVSGLVSGVRSGRANKGVCIVLGDKLKIYVREWHPFPPNSCM